MFLVLFSLLMFNSCCHSYYLHQLFSVEDSSNEIGINYELVSLPTLRIREAFGLPSAEEAINYTFNAFGDSIELQLIKNKRLLANNFVANVFDGYLQKLADYYSKDCHFIHRDGKSIAAISACTPDTFGGLLLYKDKILEIYPLEKNIRTKRFADDINASHVIRKLSLDDLKTFLNKNNSIFENIKPSGNFTKDRHRPVDAYTLELALFFDVAAYKTFSPYMDYSDGKLLDMILAYVNAVQALYHHPSLGTTLQLVLVRVDILKTQPPDFDHFDGERGKLLDSFCFYQEKLNPREDSNTDHWDMGLYISGLDFFAYENGQKSGVTMGLATVGGVCSAKYACVIAELGTTNVFGKPYPSAGFASVYILAHEIGHNLGMHHDGSGNQCSKEGFIMSPSRGTNGETQWSSCSAQVMAQLNWAKCLLDGDNPSKPQMQHHKYSDIPGQVFTAKKQCEILLTDKDAFVSPVQKLSTICYNLHCKTPNRGGYYHSGPALEGTECGKGMYCYGGDCVAKTLPKPVENAPGGWGPWKVGVCRSSCIFKSLGFQEKRRECNNPLPINSDSGCEGAGQQIALCNDEKICFKKGRKPVEQYASDQCKNFAVLLPQLDPAGRGLQAPHETNRLWIGCAIFCRHAETGTYYTPRVELNDLGISPYFPDGTWCHKDTTGNYYCQQHHCLPENFLFTKTFVNGLDADLPFAQNAQPDENKILKQLENYFSLNSDGKPLQTSLARERFSFDEDGWETKDYVELPKQV